MNRRVLLVLAAILLVGGFISVSHAAKSKSSNTPEVRGRVRL